MEKQCFKCKKIKKLEQFYKHSNMGDGHLNKCKTCTKKDTQERYNDPIARERIREYERKRFQTEHRKKKVLEYAKKAKKRTPGKTRARTKVANAIKSGKLVKLPCEKCGDTKSQAHHEDYRKPLDVMWLCFKHHREQHGQKVG